MPRYFRDSNQQAHPRPRLLGRPRPSVWRRRAPPRAGQARRGEGGGLRKHIPQEMNHFECFDPLLPMRGQDPRPFTRRPSDLPLPFFAPGLLPLRGKGQTHHNWLQSAGTERAVVGQGEAALGGQAQGLASYRARPDARGSQIRAFGRPRPSGRSPGHPSRHLCSHDRTAADRVTCEAPLEVVAIDSRVFSLGEGVMRTH